MNLRFYIFILLKLNCSVCLSGLYKRDGGIKTAIIIEIETNFQK